MLVIKILTLQVEKNNNNIITYKNENIYSKKGVKNSSDISQKKKNCFLCFCAKDKSLIVNLRWLKKKDVERDISIIQS